MASIYMCVIERKARRNRNQGNKYKKGSFKKKKKTKERDRVTVGNNVKTLEENEILEKWHRKKGKI